MIKTRTDLMDDRGFFVFAGFCFLLMTAAPTAHAQCTNPAGENGAIIYNSGANVPQGCVRGDWVALGQINPAAGGAGCSSPAGPEGQMIYNDDAHVFQYCDGDDWMLLAGGGYAAGLTGPSGCSAIGDLCADGTVFAGWHPITYDHLFIPPTDQEQPGSPGTYTMDWKNATGTDDISPDSTNDGEVNHANRGGIIGDFPAFQACEDLSVGGHSDWYLPSQVEAYYLWSVHETIEAGGNITNFQNAGYWSSTEYNANVALYQGFNGGYQSLNDKTIGYRVRCVRR